MIGALRTLFSTEPALVVGLVSAVLGVLGAFNLPITDEQSKAITAFVAAAFALGAALVIRQNVYAPASVDAAIKSVTADPGAGDGTIPALPGDTATDGSSVE